jgi:hypothetical protein
MIPPAVLRGTFKCTFFCKVNRAHDWSHYLGFSVDSVHHLCYGHVHRISVSASKASARRSWIGFSEWRRCEKFCVTFLATIFSLRVTDGYMPRTSSAIVEGARSPRFGRSTTHFFSQTEVSLIYLTTLSTWSRRWTRGRVSVAQVTLEMKM